MVNPYEPSIAPPEPPPPPEPSVIARRWRVNWSDVRAFLLAYGIHHGAGAAGIVYGWLVTPNTFPEPRPESPLGWLIALAFVPAWESFLICFTVFSDMDFSARRALYAVSFFVLTIPFAILAYGAWWRSIILLWYLGIASFLIFFSLNYIR